MVNNNQFVIILNFIAQIESWKVPWSERVCLLLSGIVLLWIQRPVAADETVQVEIYQLNYQLKLINNVFVQINYGAQ